MVQFYKVIENGFIIGIGTHGNDTVTAITENEYNTILTVTAITENEYNTILTVIHNRPADPAGYTYMLNAGTLEWEMVELQDSPSEHNYDKEVNT